jgi:hypothetical protein
MDPDISCEIQTPQTQSEYNIDSSFIKVVIQTDMAIRGIDSPWPRNPSYLRMALLVPSM